MPKAFLVSDIHLGIHPMNADTYLDIAKQYFDNFFFPLVEKHYKPGDKVFILGDIFDNRSSIDIKALCYCKDIFDWLASKNIETHVILGNHDMRAEKSYKFNSLVFLEKYSNVTLYSKPTVLEIDSVKMLMLPFITNVDEQKKVLKEYENKVKYLFCHSDLAGAKNNISSPPLTHGPSIADFVNYPFVYSGHVHLRQQIKNFTFVGSPFHLDRNDRGNRKGVYVVDIATGANRFFENDLSPEFKIVEIYTQGDVDKLDLIINNTEGKEDWLDLVINNSLLTENIETVRKLTQVSKKKTFGNIKYVDDIVITDTVENIELEDIGIKLSISELVREYVGNQTYSDENVKDQILEILEEVIDTCVDGTDEE